MGKTKKENKKPKESQEDLKPKLSESSDTVIAGKIKKKKNKKDKKPKSPEKVQQIKQEIDERPDIVVDIKKEKTDKKKKKDKKLKLKKQNGAEIKKEVKTEIKTEATTENGTPVKADKKSSNSEESKKKLHHDSKPENTIFVGNLANTVKPKQLSGLFGQFGKVVSVRMRTGNGKKLFKHSMRKKAESLNAYVVFDNVESKEKALKLSGTEYKGRHIRVTTAQDYANEAEPKRIVFVGNLKYSATDEKLYEIFSTCGELEYVRTVTNDKGCAGVAYVCFKKPESVQLALELNNTMLDERPIRVQRYKKNPEKVQTQQKVASGPVRRLLEKKKANDKKNNKNQKNMKNNKNAKREDGKQRATPKKEKKSDFHGKKTSAEKKKNKAKKKGPSHLEKLAKKIAPK